MNLQTYGFVFSGRWEITSSVKSGVTFTLTRHTEDRVVYAFVVNDQPKYIGICEKLSTSLMERMRRYKYRQGTGTNAHVAGKIRQHLMVGKEVQILSLKPEKDLRFTGLEIDLVKGLENPLIQKFQPNWNKWGGQ